MLYDLLICDLGQRFLEDFGISTQTFLGRLREKLREQLALIVTRLLGGSGLCCRLCRSDCSVDMRLGKEGGAVQQLGAGAGLV